MLRLMGAGCILAGSGAFGFAMAAASRKVSACCNHTLLVINRLSVNIFNVVMSMTFQNIFQSLYDAVDCSRSNDSINLWNLFLNLFPITLCQTTCNNKCFDISILS